VPEHFVNQAPLADALWLRSLRFAISVLVPPAGCWALHYEQGIIFALVPAIASFSTDPGGPPLSRLIWTAAGGIALVVGNVAGALVPGGAESAALFAAAGAIYAFFESSHQIVVTIARFLCFGLAIGAFYAHAGLIDIAIVAGVVAFVFLVSLAADLMRGGLRSSTAPSFREIVDGIEARETERLVFAASAAIAVALAYAASASFQLTRSYWTLIALVLVLRLDFMSSWRLVIQRIAGTICGVLVAGFVVIIFPSHAMQAGAMLVAALLRWPAQQRHNLLGVAALTAFVMLLIDLAASSRQEALLFLGARLLDTIVGCLFALVALCLTWTGMMVIRRGSGRAAREGS
jgi:uncharacterized membrane protein YccC